MIRLDGSKMSKSKGNLVAPEAIIDTLGADALRLSHLAVKPPEEDVDWEDFGLDGCHRFLQRVWRLAVPESDLLYDLREGELSPADLQIIRSTHHLIDDVTTQFERWSYNVAVARYMAFINEVYRYVQSGEGAHAQTIATAIDTLLQVLAPACPHMTAELWSRRRQSSGDAGGTVTHVHTTPWPVADPDLLREESVTMVVQVNGKVRDRIEVAPDVSEVDAIAAALASEKVQSQVGGAEPKRIIARPPKLVNLVM